MIIEPPVTFLPSLRSSAPQLFTKIFTDERMGVQISAMMRIFTG
jgi:hypothetical protein